MTKDKSFKRRVRARMDKTSERYATARRQLLAESADAGAGASAAPGTGPAEPAQAPPAVAPGARRPYSDEVVRANTGRGWDEWFALLDGWGAAERPHPEIARWLVEEHGVGGWWAQGVTVGYEQARGLRAPGQRRGGAFEVNASRTVGVPVGRLYEAFADPAARGRWLPGVTLEVRTARPARSLRADWEDGATRLVVSFTARGDAKSQVALVHERVPDAATADKLRDFWRERLATLKRVLEA
jgi:uncharacterized protein YndB with AHSA1/START domain